ncbi:hypothetical protein Ate02nite_87350 [Paractinoplanes tereljensis]|uniref:Transposase n=1 Tax=Paractinoplanes tereljensis TaxID=571912 RepID=A0A919NVL8_9ACTN|nr:hypothetical protein Ate02nite_87350 [Actinoplanes tereljensis]
MGTTLMPAHTERFLGIHRFTNGKGARKLRARFVRLAIPGKYPLVAISMRHPIRYTILNSS